jgi:hypothetical protein
LVCILSNKWCAWVGVKLGDKLYSNARNLNPWLKKKKKKKKNGTTLSYTASTRFVTTVAQCRSSPDQPHYLHHLVRLLLRQSAAIQGRAISHRPERTDPTVHVSDPAPPPLVVHAQRRDPFLRSSMACRKPSTSSSLAVFVWPSISLAVFRSTSSCHRKA